MITAEEARKATKTTEDFVNENLELIETAIKDACEAGVYHIRYKNSMRCIVDTINALEALGYNVKKEYNYIEIWWTK